MPTISLLKNTIQPIKGRVRLVIPFFNGISPKLNVIVQIAYYDVTFQHVSHNPTGIHLYTYCCTVI